MNRAITAPIIYPVEILTPVKGLDAANNIVAFIACHFERCKDATGTIRILKGRFHGYKKNIKTHSE
jgi:hypothetical protein